MSQNPSKKSDQKETNADYRVLYPTEKHHQVIKDFVATLQPKEQDQVWDVILDLGKKPRPDGYIQIRPPIPALSLLAHYRIASGNFRIFYDIDDEKKKVWILAVRRRNEKTYRR